MESITDQLRVLEDVAKQRGFEIVDVFQESKSAKNPGREGFTQMIERISKGEANGILCWKLNRLSRNPVDGGTLSWLLQRGVIQRIATVERDYHPTDNVLMMQVEFGMANQFLLDLSKDTRRGLIGKAERGWLPSGAVTGYTHNPFKKKGDKEIIKDEPRFTMMRTIFDLILAGTHNPKQALEYATNELGMRNAKGQKISQSTIYVNIHNPFYYGRFEYPKGSGNWYDGKHEPMLTKAEFDAIQAKISPTSRPLKSVKPENEFLYRGPMRCGECGAKITAERKKKMQKNGNIHRYIYYHCTWRVDPNCTQKSIQENDLVPELANKFDEITLSEPFYKWALETLDEIGSEEQGVRESNTEGLLKEIEAVDTRMKKLLDIRLNDSIDDETYKTKKGELEKEKEELNRVLASRLTDEKEIRVKAETYLNLSKDMRTRFEKGTPEERRNLFLSVGSNLYLKDKKLRISLPSPLGVVSDIVRWGDEHNFNVRTAKDGTIKRRLCSGTPEFITMLPLLSEFRTVDWKAVKRELEFSGLVPTLGLQIA